VKIKIYSYGDRYWDGRPAPTDTYITEVGSWAQLITIYNKPTTAESRGICNAVIAALEGNLNTGIIHCAGNRGDKDYGYYAVVEE
jgi:hypothetical protein